MKLYWFLIGILCFLSACSAPEPVAVPTALPSATQDSPLPASTPTSVVPTPEPSAATPAPAEDLFSQAGISLEAPVCAGATTPAQTEGPYYTANTPERNSFLEAGIPGERLIVVGYVLDANCQPIPNAWFDFWQTDGAGNYDNSGFKLRGHQFTDAQGRYFLETVRPGEYPGRPPHIHVKVQASPDAEILTSQLYFPDAAANSSDGIFTPETLVKIEQRADHWVAYYNFVLP